jgi:hypothetical protein
MLNESVTNVKPIGNGLVKSVTDQCPIGNRLLKSITDHSVLVMGYSPLLISSYWRRMLVGCVSFDWHPGSPFLTSETHVVISSVCLCLILSTPLALSPQKLGHSCSDNNTCSLSSEGHSLDLCAQMSPPACPVRRRQLRVL